MTLRNIQQGEVVTVRIYKQYVGFSWANNYEVAATTNINDPAQSLADMVDRLVALERLLHLQGVIIDRATVSSYVPDSQPYDPDTLTTFLILFQGSVLHLAKFCRLNSVYLSVVTSILGVMVGCCIVAV